MIDSPSSLSAVAAASALLSSDIADTHGIIVRPWENTPTERRSRSPRTPRRRAPLDGRQSLWAHGPTGSYPGFARRMPRSSPDYVDDLPVSQPGGEQPSHTTGG